MKKVFKKFIVVDENKCPMSFDVNQFAYCDMSWPVKLYTKKKAEELIKKTLTYRHRLGFSSENYLLLPVETK